MSTTRRTAPSRPAPPGARPVHRRHAHALLAALLVAPGTARPAEPLSTWLDGLGDAAASLDAGDASASLAAAERALGAVPLGPAGGRASLAVGLAQLGRGSADLAIGPLRAALAEGVQPARLAALAALGQALLEAGRPADAAPVLAEVAAAGPARLARRARWQESQALLSIGLVPQAVTRLDRLLAGSPEDPEALAGRLRLAGALRLLGRPGRALALYRALALEEPDRPEGTAALEALQRWHEAGGPVPSPSAEDRLARAERLVARGRAAEALRELDLAAGATSPAPAGQLSLMRAIALLALGRHAEAERLVGPLVGRDAAPGVRRAATWVLARAASRAGRIEEAVRAYAEVARMPGGLPGLPAARWRDLADEAAFLSAWLWYDAGDLRRATRELARFARDHPGSRRVDDARWFIAWAWYRLGDRRAAARALARLADGPLADAALYWSGRLAPSPAAALERYRRAAAIDPDGWYAALARARLAAAGLPPPPAAAAAGPLQPLSLDDGPAGRRVAAAASLLSLGWAGAARAELDDLLRRREGAQAAGSLAELARYAGSAELPFRAARDLLGATPRTRRWLFPDPHPALPALARAAGLDPALLRAVVRKESAFRPGARSAAGALGLTQLLPGTAARLAALAGAAPPAQASLLEPAPSLALGAHYLGLLQDRFGSEAVALAAYNAGPTPVSAWARDRRGLPLDEWVEDIPYRETRAYVKAVLAAREAYRRLAGLAPALDPDRATPAPGDGAAF